MLSLFNFINSVAALRRVIDPDDHLLDRNPAVPSCLAIVSSDTDRPTIS